jgi:hypothetical protein|tara:strand:- start:3261 stop:3728 length:468 start_codon:yes stop_codon:yes gene_type:complete
MGRDYDATVICAGFGGISLGSTPTAMANMTAMTQQYGPSTHAFLIVPLVWPFPRSGQRTVDSRFFSVGCDQLSAVVVVHGAEFSHHCCHCSGSFGAPVGLAFQSLHPLVTAMAEVGPLGEQPLVTTAGRRCGPDGGQCVTKLLTGDANHQRTTGA